MAVPLAEFLVAFIAAAAIVRVLAGAALARLVIDVPNDRSLHATPMPRTGGVGLLAGAAIAWALSVHTSLSLTAGLAAALAATFLIEDVCGLPTAVRLALQASAAIAFVLSSPLGVSSSPLLVCVLVVGIVWGMNAYNFMDGANGLAGGMAVFGFGAYAVAAHMAGAADLAAAAAIVGGAALGFLVWNFDPARIFLGDAGSIPLCSRRSSAWAHSAAEESGQPAAGVVSRTRLPDGSATSQPSARRSAGRPALSTRSASAARLRASGKTTAKRSRPREPGGGGRPAALAQVLSPRWWW